MTWTTPRFLWLDLAETRGIHCDGEHFNALGPVSYRVETVLVETGEIRRKHFCRQHASEIAGRHHVTLPPAGDDLGKACASDVTGSSQAKLLAEPVNHPEFSARAQSAESKEKPKPSRPPKIFVIPPGTPMATCSSCRANIRFVPTATGKQMPVNPDGTSHFIDCQGANRHRRPRA